MPFPYGYTGLGPINSDNQFNSIAADIGVWRFRFKWTDIEGAQDAFSFTYIKQQIDKPILAGKKVIVQMLVSPNSTSNPTNDNTPAYIWANGVPKVFTTASATTYYPYYLNSYYTTRWYNAITKFIDYLATLPTLYKGNIQFFFSAEGKTGDTDPYAGTPNNNAYKITAVQWNDYKDDFWAFLVAKLASTLPGTKAIINPGNDGERFQYLVDTYSDVTLKYGNGAHNYGLPGNKDAASRFSGLRDPKSGHYVVGETEGTVNLAGTTAAPLQFYWAIATEALHSGMSQLNLAYGNWQTNRFPYQFFNKYAGIGNIEDTDKGFSKLRRQIDVANMAFAPSFPLINPADQNTYDRKVAGILASTKPDAQKANQITSLKIQYVNPARLTELQSLFPGFSLQTLQMGNDQDMRTQDYGMDIIESNHERYLYEYLPALSAYHSNRIGASDETFGRSTSKIGPLLPERWWYAPLIGEHNYQVEIKVVYKDTTGVFLLYYHNGTAKVSAGSVTKTGTGRFLTKTFTISNMQGGRLLENNNDFSLRWVSGSETDLDYIEFIRIAENTPVINVPPVFVSADYSYSITLPVNEQQFDFTGSYDTDGTIAGYGLTFISGPPVYTLDDVGSAMPTVSGLVAGTYVFRGSVTDDQGDIAYGDITVEVTDDAPPDSDPFAIITSEFAFGYVSQAYVFDGEESFDNDGTIEAYAWTITGPENSSGTDAQIVLIPGQTGLYTIELTVTDNDGNTDTDSMQFEVFDAALLGIGAFPREVFKYAIVDPAFRSATLDNGMVSFIANPTFIKHHPEGWRDLEVAFGTNEKYFSLNRTVTLPLKFVLDGGQILRQLVLKGKGYEAEFYLHMLRWNRANGIHEREYYGKFDFSKYSDDPNRGVTVNCIEGGPLLYLSANETKEYDILADESQEEMLKVNFDGITLQDKYNYDTYEYDLSIGNYLLPIVFINNEGDSVGITFGNQQPDRLDTMSIGDFDDYIKNGSNYPFETATAITTAKVAGSLPFVLNDFYSPSSPTGTIELSLIRSQHPAQYVQANRVALGDIHVSNIGQTYILTVPETSFEMYANEKLYVQINVEGLGTGAVTDITILDTGGLNVEFVTKNPPSLVYSMTMLRLGQLLFDKMTEGKYKLDSMYLRSNLSIVAYCGDSLRGTSHEVVPKWYMATNFADWFKSVNSGMYGTNFALKLVDNVLYVEPKTMVYGGVNTIFELGEVSEFSYQVNTERLISSIKCGYPEQDFDQRNGKYEFNTPREYKAPVTSTAAVYNIENPYRGGCYDQEFIRGGLNNKDTTDNTGDKNVFIGVIDIIETGRIYLAQTTILQTGQILEDETLVFGSSSGSGFQADATKRFFTYLLTAGASYPTDVTITGNITSPIGTGFSAQILVNGIEVGRNSVVRTGANTPFLLKVYANPVLNTGDIVSVRTDVGTSVVIEQYASLNMKTSVIDYNATYNLSRPAYSATEGIIDQTVFNTEITPARCVIGHGDYLHSLLIQQPEDYIKFLTGSKNTQLSTTLGDVTIDEDADIAISSLAEPFFIPYVANFKCPVPYTFSQTLMQMNAGLISFKFRGYTMYGLPIGDMSVKPATEEPQEWNILLSSKTDLNVLLLLSGNGLFINDSSSNTMIKIPDYNPLHFVKYGYTPPAGYVYKNKYDDWAVNRLDAFAFKPQPYFQKYQFTDSINLIFPTAGVGQLQIFVYGCNEEIVQTYSCEIVQSDSFKLPNILQQVNISLTGYNEGHYLFVVKNGSTNIAISEWVHIKERHTGTYRFDYYNSYDQVSLPWAGYRPQLRVEALFLRETPDNDVTDYVDEPRDVAILHGVAATQQDLVYGPAAGMPEWMNIKIANVWLLDRVSVEGKRVNKKPGSEIEEVNPGDEGWQNYYSRVTVVPAFAETGITFTDTGEEITNGLAVYTLNASDWGKSDDGTLLTSETKSE